MVSVWGWAGGGGGGGGNRFPQDCRGLKLQNEVQGLGYKVSRWSNTLGVLPMPNRLHEVLGKTGLGFVLRDQKGFGFRV